jgi:hypothetical protein
MNRLPQLLLLLYALLCLAGLTWPGLALLGNRVEPRVLGLPFVMAYNVGWVVLSFLALLGYHAWTGRRRGGGDR